jgi:hypothetical protein
MSRSHSFLANDLEIAFIAQEAEVIGLIAELSKAVSQLGRDGFDTAVIDINLHDQGIFDCRRAGAPRYTFCFCRRVQRSRGSNRLRNVIRLIKRYELPKKVPSGPDWSMRSSTTAAS